MGRALAAVPWALLALATTARIAVALEIPPPSSTSLIVGELTRVDLARRSVVVKTEGRETREREAWVGAETRVVSRGRAVRLEDLRPGDRVVVVAAEDGGKHLARVIKVVGRTAVASPSPLSTSPSPPAAPSPATGGSRGRNSVFFD